MMQHNQLLQAKYQITAWFYDLLDYPWERQYRHWRPQLLQDLHGKVLEAGVGTGRNLPYYPKNVDLTAIELSPAMLRRARKRAQAQHQLQQDDATLLTTIDDNQFDYIISTFMCCVMPDTLQPQALQQFARVLKPGGKFRLLEMVYSKDPALYRRQQRFAPFVEKVYGARFDRRTVDHIKSNPQLEISDTRFLKADTYLLIEGYKLPNIVE